MQNDKYLQPMPPQLAQNPGYPSTSNTYPAQNVVQSSDTSQGCFARSQRNKPQGNAVGAGSLIFISGGMNIAWSLQLLSTTHFRISWFVGAIIGAFISAILVKFIPKKHIIQFASLLVFIDGIVLAATKANYDAVIAARYLDGIGNGLVFAITLTQIGEIVIKSQRGMIAASTEQMSFNLGIMLQTLYTVNWTVNPNESFTTIQLQGVLSAIYGLIAFAAATFLMVESPIDLLDEGQEEKAIDVLRRLQRPAILTTETYEQLEDHKRYLQQNNQLSKMESAQSGLAALCRLIFYRALNAMSISRMVLTALLLCSISENLLDTWPFTIFCLARFLGSVIAIFPIDRLTGRKKLTLFTVLVCAGLAFGFAPVFDNATKLQNLTTISISGVIILFIYQFFAGAACNASSAYLSEAFPRAVKHNYITAAFVIEMLVQLIICVCDISFNGLVNYFYILGAISLVFFLMGIFCLPETKGLPLNEAQAKFRGFISRDF